MTDTPTDDWTHAALTWNADGDHTIYVNGEPGEVVIGVGDDFDFGENDTGDWTIGGDGLGTHPENLDQTRHLRGELADFAIFNGELTEDEIRDIISSGVAVSLPGDFNRNGEIDAGDLDVHAQMIKDMDPAGDVNGNGTTDAADRITWIETIQKSWAGDANFDNEFNSGDLVTTFSAGLYETGEMGTYAQGDWNGDMLFDSGDLVFAFAHGGYEFGPPAATAAVPEPAASTLIAFGFLAVVMGRRRRVLRIES